MTEPTIPERLAVVIAAAEHQRRINNEPCPTCGGDRLRPDFTDSGLCHSPRGNYDYH